MNKKHGEEITGAVVGKYENGQSVALLCVEYGIPRSTVYFGIKRHKKLKSTTNVDISYKDYYNLKRRADKLDEKLKVIKAAGCGLSAPLQEKLMALEALYGQYSVHVLCHEGLCIRFVRKEYCAREISAAG